MSIEKFMFRYLADSGILLSPSDPPDQWAEKIECILSDKDLYARLSNNAVLNAGDAKFNPHNIALRFLDIADKHSYRGSR